MSLLIPILLLLFVLGLLAYLLLHFYSSYQSIQNGGHILGLPHGDVDFLFKTLEPSPGQRLIDLGSGDGRLVFVAAEQFALRAIGVEIAWLPYLKSIVRWTLLPKAVRSLVTFVRVDLYTVPLQDADIIVVYQITNYMPRLAELFSVGANPRAKIVSIRYPLPGWTPQKVIEGSAFPLYFYHMSGSPVGESERSVTKDRLFENEAYA